MWLKQLMHCGTELGCSVTHQASHLTQSTKLLEFLIGTESAGHLLHFQYFQANGKLSAMLKRSENTAQAEVHTIFPFSLQHIS